MNKKHQPFTAHDGTTVNVISSCGSIHMGIPNQKGYTYVTKQEAMDFFGLMEKPEPKKPFYAELIKAHIMGEVIECRYELWQPSTHWELLSNADPHIAAAFLGEEEDRRYSFRIKPE